MCVRVAIQLVTEQGQSKYRKLQRRVSPAGVFLNYYVKYCIRFYGACIINLIFFVLFKKNGIFAQYSSFLLFLLPGVSP
jgi:hypothetical protein